MKKVTVIGNKVLVGEECQTSWNAALLRKVGMELRNGTLVGDLHTNSVLKDPSNFKGVRILKGILCIILVVRTAENLINRE